MLEEVLWAKAKHRMQIQGYTRSEMNWKWQRWADIEYTGCPSLLSLNIIQLVYDTAEAKVWEKWE